MSKNNQLKEFFNKNLSYAIVGASNNENKFGYKIFKSLLNSKYNVYAVNPKEKQVLGQKCYKSLSEIPEDIDVVNFVVPSNVTLKVLEEAFELGIEKVWFQPGSFNENCISFCRQNKILYVNEFCLLETVLNKSSNANKEDNNSNKDEE